MAEPRRDRLAIHTRTTAPLPLRRCVEVYAAHGVRAIGVWRDAVAACGGAAEAARILADGGVRVPSLVRGGFFVAADDAGRRAAIDETRSCLDEAVSIGAESVVVVPGAVPGVPLDVARGQVEAALAAVLPHAHGCGVRLALEPLHPMYAGDKSCVNRLADARALCERLDDAMLGVAVDVYHTWWDPDLRREIDALGRQRRLFGFHLCDWRVPTRDLLLDRALMGDGCIPLAQIRAAMAAAGFSGCEEVEIFSSEWWAGDQERFVAAIVAAWDRLAAPAP